MNILKWLTVAQTAKSLGISTPATYRAIEAGRLHVARTPLGTLVDPASVEAYRRTRRPVRMKGVKVGRVAC
jgi:excisionase family DNA binding protein